MKKRFLAKPIQFSEMFRIFSLGLLLSAVFILSLMFFNTLFVHFAHASDETIVTSPSPEILDRVRDAVLQFQSGTPAEHFGNLIDKADAVVRDKLCGDDGSGGSEGCTAKKNPVYVGHDDQTEDATSLSVQSEQPEQESKGKFFVSDDSSRVYYFFSFSMPAESLQQAVRNIYELRRQEKNVVMVIRGFVKNDMQATVMAFEKLKRESGINSDMPVDIDPPLWEQYGITKVPVIVSTSKRGAGKITGDVGIPYALSRFDAEVEDYGTVGHTYEIAEEDLLKVIASKQPMIEEKLRQRMETLQEEMYVLKKHDGQYEKAVEDRAYYIDPSLVLTDDVYDHEGKVLFAKGSVFNPTDHVSLGRHIIIDGKDVKQVRLALAGDYRKVMIISGDLAKLATTHRKRFWFVPDDILRRLQIRRVPAVFEQEGKYIRVTEKAI
ncbi:MAG: TrbC family F-type conjugative pilus assembly protein [Syntrophus sp. (in: bacteria)]